MATTVRGTRSPKARSAGFTLIEVLMATALMGAILAALATVTAQWLPNWNRGFARVQRNEQLAAGLERVVGDLAAAEFVSVGRDVIEPLFDDSELSVTLVRSAIGPNARSGLEIVRMAETGSDRGPALVRSKAPFMPVIEGVNDRRPGPRRADQPSQSAADVMTKLQAQSTADRGGAARGRAPDGFIIEAVLWILGALATLASIYAIYIIDTAFVAKARDERVVVDGMIQAALELTAYQVTSKPGERQGHGAFSFRLGNAVASAQFRSEGGRIDLNQAPKELLAGLFMGFGARPD